MPRRDGTGPEGQGPGTGRKQGPCRNDQGQRSGQGQGRRRTGGQGQGRGGGRRQ